MQWLISEVFAPAMFIADTFAGNDPNAIIAVLLCRDDEHAFLRFTEGLKRADKELDSLPKDVADEVRTLQRIENSSVGTISVDDGWEYYRKTDLHAVAKRGWSAVLRHIKPLPFPSAGTDPPAMSAADKPEQGERNSEADAVVSASGYRSKGRKMSKVFISYSHDSDEHCEHVLKLANALRSHGVETELDRYHVRPPEGWPLWCEKQLRPENSDFVLMICTDTYCRRVEGKVPADEGRGVIWEGRIIYDYIYDAKANTRFIPVLLSGANAECIPMPIRNHTKYQIGRFDLVDDGYNGLYRELTKQPAVTKPALGQVVPLSPHAATAAAAPLDPRPVETTFHIPTSPHEAPRSPKDKTSAIEVGEIQRLQREGHAAMQCDPENIVLFEQKLNEIELLNTVVQYNKVTVFLELGQEVALNSDRGTCLLVEHILWQVVGWDRVSIIREIMGIEAARSLAVLIASAFWEIGVSAVEYGRSRETVQTLTRAILEIYEKARLIGAEEVSNSCHSALDGMLSKARSDKRADVIGLVEQAIRNLVGESLPPN